MLRFRLLLLPLALGCADTRAAALDLRMEASTAWAENIARSSAPADWRDAMRHEVQASASLLRQWTDGLVTTGSIDAGFERLPQFTRNDAARVGLSFTARQKFGWGAYAPLLAFDAGLRHREAQIDGDDGWTASGALRASRRLTSAWRLAATGDWQQHYARSPVWDTRHHRLFGTLTWDVTNRLQLSHGQGRLWGQFTANASPRIWALATTGALGANLSDYYKTVPRAVTHSYGPDWVSYRVAGHVSFWWLELAPALGRDTSLPLRYESLFSVNRAGVKYRQDIWTLQWLHRF
jgi:hypothetical protein